MKINNSNKALCILQELSGHVAQGDRGEPENLANNKAIFTAIKIVAETELRYIDQSRGNWDSTDQERQP